MSGHSHLAPLLVALAVGALTWAVAHRMRLNERLGATHGPLEGFAGWLLFLAVLQWVGVIHTLGDVGVSLGHQKLVELASLGPYGRSGYIVAVVLQVLVFVFVLSSAIMMQRRSRLFPTLFRIEMALLVLVPIVVALATSWEAERGEMPSVVRMFHWARVAVLAPLAGIGYVYSLRSVRVRNTFVR